jgi:ribA/ribD-fused uncharacterized protein
MITKFREDYAFLSNFWTAPFEAPWFHVRTEPVETQRIMGGTWLTVEHYFQAAKCGWWEGVGGGKVILHAPNSREAKRLGRQVELRRDWERLKLQVMTEGLRLKFTQNPDLKAKLVATHPETLVEGNTWGDRYWGQVWEPYHPDGWDYRNDCPDTRGLWRGENWLGKCLEMVREELRA